MAIPFLIPAAITLAAEFFPSLANKIGGKRGAEIAQTIVKTAATVAGVSTDTSVQEIISRVNASAGARDQLTYELEQLNLRETEVLIEDRQQARTYQLQAGALRGNYMLIGVSMALVSCVLIIVLPKLFAGSAGPDAGLSAGELTFLATISGALLKMLSDAFAFEFGSSRGSKEKDEEATEMKSAILKLGQERQAADQEVIRAQERRLVEAQAAIQAVMPVAAVAAIGAQGVGKAAELTRNFVAELVGGKLEA